MNTSTSTAVAIDWNALLENPPAFETIVEIEDELQTRIKASDLRILEGRWTKEQRNFADGMLNQRLEEHRELTSRF